MVLRHDVTVAAMAVQGAEGPVCIVTVDTSDVIAFFCGALLVR